MKCGKGFDLKKMDQATGEASSHVGCLEVVQKGRLSWWAIFPKHHGFELGWRQSRTTLLVTAFTSMFHVDVIMVWLWIGRHDQPHILRHSKAFRGHSSPRRAVRFLFPSPSHAFQSRRRCPGHCGRLCSSPGLPGPNCTCDVHGSPPAPSHRSHWCRQLHWSRRPGHWCGRCGSRCQPETRQPTLSGEGKKSFCMAGVQVG